MIFRVDIWWNDEWSSKCIARCYNRNTPVTAVSNHTKRVVHRVNVYWYHVDDAWVWKL